MSQLNCNQETHEGDPIKSLCLRKNCNQSSAQCYSCTFEFHKDCINYTKMLKEIPQLLLPFQLIKKVLSELLMNVNQVMKELNNQIENILKPIEDWLNNPNLTNLNKLGLFLKEENELKINHQVESVEKQIKIFFQDWKMRIKCKDLEKKVYANQTDNKNAKEWFSEGCSLRSLNKFQEAIDCYQKAINLDPKFKDAWYAQGFALQQLNKFQEAIYSYQKAINLDPTQKEAWYAQGLALQYLNKFQEAIDCYRKAINIDPKYTNAINGLKQSERSLRQQ